MVLSDAKAANSSLKPRECTKAPAAPRCFAWTTVPTAATVKPAGRVLLGARSIDFYDDPDAPTTNRPVSERGGHQQGRRHPHRSDDPTRQLGRPVRAIDLGGSITQAAVRETREETGVECEIVGRWASMPIRGGV
ncbi:NUDIX domain-containing protein [Sphaerisporangium viridialbum]|uniref:NUDIX domain-containing protein n=1 Tax=Sphaerisporangium viridialbum TaxID=46189 RepID=UPI003C76C670